MSNFLDKNGLGHILLSLIQWGTSFVLEAPKDGKLYVRQNGKWVAIDTSTPPFIPVTSITGLPSSATVGKPLTLVGTVNPNNATNKTITWSILHAGSAYGQVSGNTFTAYYSGTATVRATVINGASPTMSYTQDFVITVSGSGGGYYSGYDEYGGYDDDGGYGYGYGNWYY